MYTVRIKNNETGEIRDVEVDLPWENHHEYLWTEGNYGCDCNRAIMFHQKDVKPVDSACGETRYTCIDATLSDGAVVVLDEAEG